MKKLLTLYLILCSFVSFAQNKTIDSLQQVLKNYDAKKLELHKNQMPDESDSTRVNILNKLASENMFISDYAVAKKYANEALAIAQQIVYKKGVANLYNTLGNINYYQGNLTEALNNHFAALKINEEIGDKKRVSANYGNIGLVYGQQGNYPEALKNHIASLKLKEEIGDKKGIAFAYNNIGLIYNEQGNSTEALKNFLASLKIIEELGDKYRIAISYTNIGMVYNQKGNYPEALKYFLSALKINEETGNKNDDAQIYINIGNTYFGQGIYPEALKNYSTSLEIFEKIGDKNGIAECYLSIGATKIKMHAAKEGKICLMKSLQNANENKDIPQMKDSYEELVKADSALGNFKGAYENHKLFVLYRDSLNNEENTKKITQQQMQYEFDKKQVADSLKFAQEKELGAVKLQKQKAITYGGFAGIAITIVLLVFVYRNYSRQRIANQKLKEAQEQLIKSEKMAAFGIMASRVSHEIQNPLNFVNNFSDLAEEMVNDIVKLNSEQERNETAKDLINNLQKIKHHGMRADTIVKQLQEHTNKGTAHEYFEAKQQ